MTALDELMEPVADLQHSGNDDAESITTEEICAYLDGEISLERARRIEATIQVDEQLAAKMAVIARLTGHEMAGTLFGIQPIGKYIYKCADTKQEINQIHRLLYRSFVQEIPRCAIFTLVRDHRSGRKGLSRFKCRV